MKKQKNKLFKYDVINRLVELLRYIVSVIAMPDKCETHHTGSTRSVLNVLNKVIVFASLMLLGAFLFGCQQQTGSTTVSENNVRNYVVEDLAAKFPDADIREIVEMTPSDGSWYVKARVTYNFTTPCPVRMNVYYDYPKKGFIESPPEYITKGCSVCREGTCVIGTPEEAIIASHTMKGTDAVRSYLSAHSDAKPEVKLYSEYVDADTAEKYTNVWIVKWYSEKTNYAEFVIVSNNGEILKVWQAIKTETV